MSFLAADNVNSDILCSVIEHVFMPPKLPQIHQGKQIERETNVALCSSLIEAAQHFLPDISSSESTLWMHMIKMIELARRAANAPYKNDELQHAFLNMAIGDVFCMHIRAQNAALIVRRLALDFVQFEVFEVSPPISAVMKTKGKLVCSYPGPAIQVPTTTFMDKHFLRELSSFLVQMDVDRFRTTSLAGSVVRSVHESAHPKYISELLVGILRGFGRPAVVDRITKRIGDEVLFSSSLPSKELRKDKPRQWLRDTPWRSLLVLGRNKSSPDESWRRSPLWLILKVSLQSSLNASNLYKPFILFFHAHLLHTCVHREFSSELLYAMRAKMVRRLSKMGPVISHHVYQLVNDTAKEAEELLSRRWTAFRAIKLVRLQPEKFDFVTDTHISLDNSYTYLAKMLSSGSRGFSQMPFTPSLGLRLYDIQDFTQFTNGKLANAIAKDSHIALADFELSVERHLESWVVASTNNNDALDVIVSCVQQYFAGAKDLYGTNAEDNSIMILTIMYLWVALDRFAVQECPLLKQYSPEIPSDFLHALLLHRSSSLKRASYIEEYLYQRHKEALKVTSIFSNRADDSCFALKYFRTSENLQRLHDEIITRARRRPVVSRAELVTWEEESRIHLRLASYVEHEGLKDNVGGRIHSATCQKCQLEDQAMAMRIAILEWSILCSTAHAQLVVFELSPPRAFSAWRDITYMILRDIGLHLIPDPVDIPDVFLGSFSGLQDRAVQSQQYGRVTICSTITSFSGRTDNNMVGIPTEASSVSVDSGLSFMLFDRNRRSWAMNSFSRSTTVHLCSPPIPDSSPYTRLHRFVSSTQHTPNDIIATQADCPDEISPHEFMSFSGLRSGPRLQWLNIARELASPSLSFSREEVHTLITQAAWQLGPLSNGVREWHIDLSTSSFGITLLRELESLLEKIRANWQEEVTARTIALICGRLLASTKDADICVRACTLLRRARNLTFRWMDELGKKLDSSQDDTSRAGLRHRLCMLAATCFSTFDVCWEHVPAVLTSEEDFSIAMQCAVIVHENTPPSLSDDNSVYLSRMLSRHRRLMHALEPIFSEPLLPVPGRAGMLHAGAYDRALARLWPRYRQCNSSGWHALPGSNSSWIFCVTEEGQKVQYNLLTGELLIGGRRFGRLPQEIVEHDTYASIFGSRHIDVAPADIPGMDYLTRFTVFGHQILFSWNKGDLILQARKPEDLQTLQLIPRIKLLDDFPRCLVDEYVHWLDLSTGELEFRPAGSPWTPGPSNWRLYIQKPGIYPRARLQKPHQEISLIQLIDVRSSTFEGVSGLLSPIESPEHILATRTDQTLGVSLPRLHLAFFFNAEWELECQSMLGYVVDKAQSCGTLFGLRNKLVLCPSPTSFKEPLPPRRVIIPQGEISFSTNGDFTSVSINTGAEQHVRWHEYTIDTDLGCLTSNAGLSSKLYQYYLHALTSHCLPDPLLGHTGTEEALYILRSAACQSFQRLEVHEARLLNMIGNLSPDRDYNSGSLHPTTNVKWKDLPALSQHDDFFRTVRSLLDHAHALEALYDQPTIFETASRDKMLLDRAAFRNRTYYPSDLHTLGTSSSLIDIEYRSRDVPDHGSAENVAFQTSWSIWNSRLSLDPKLPELWDLMLWDSIGPARSGISLRYSRYWVTFNAAQDWLVIYDLCRKSVNRDRRSLRIELSFSLSAAAYCQSKSSKLVPFFMIFALDERFRKIGPPPHASYTLSDGLSPKVTRREIDEKKYLRSISRNIQLREHVRQLQGILQHYRNVLVPAAVPYFFSPQHITSHSRPPSYSLRNVLASRTNVPTTSPDRERFRDLAIPPTTTAETVSRPVGSGSLEILVKELQDSQRPLLRLYGNELENSHRHLFGENAFQLARGSVPSHEFLLLYHKGCSDRKDKMFSEISAALSPSKNVEETNRIAGLWPRITPRSILCLLAQDRFSALPNQWKLVIMCYAVSFVKYQQSLRLLELSSRQKREEILLEIAAIRDDVLAKSTSDWLLVQIDANFVARSVQVDIAHEMISPRSRRNISLQFNMGEGKSSVIVPLVVSTLANRSNLVRVVTLKPLSNQMFQLLVSRLSGLANRPIFYVPISRGLRMDISLARTIRGLYGRCFAKGGILIVQPEHILSLKLMHFDFLLRSERNSKERSVAYELGALQDWLTKASRDVLDESDEILHVRYQLIYGSGEQMPVDDHPNRWTTIQEVLGRLQAHAMKLRPTFPTMFEIDSTQRGFPIIRILDSASFHRISSLIIDDALDGALSSLPVGVLPSSTRAAARRFMSRTEVSDVDHALVQSRCTGTTFFKGILLLRGLLNEGEGVLGYVLNERHWRVDYGLDPGRTLLAVPYRAKDVPNQRAEFAHPDVAITLTCLSYYYGGLTKDQVLKCFELLAKLGNPEMEYDHWVESGQDLPTALHQLRGVNTEDETQVEEFLVPLFSRNKSVVDFYLSRVVFPRSAREFPSKLPTSAWDLVEEKRNITTGFSGTNDNRYLLPTSITQEDPDFVLGTDALVLQHLLRPENDHYECLERSNRRRESATTFLKRLVKRDPEIRVLLDVGAQMLELQNEELARHWLSLRPDVSAAIFFDELDNLTVITPDGITEPFISSPFKRQVEKCVVYLDDAHTRGTDLKFAQGTRAAVTLGPKVTKDRLVQGCMRMRQLGKGHSVMFFAPGEVDRRIRSLIPNGIAPEDRIRVLDIVRWAMHRTCEDISHHLPFWALQGLDHYKRFAAYHEYRSGGDLQALRDAWLQSESRTLEEMYWVAPCSKTIAEISSVPSLSERVKLLGVTKLVHARMAEEQEREVNNEVEQGHTEIEHRRPPKAHPMQHMIHGDIREFIETGKLPEFSAYLSSLLAPINMAKTLDSATDWSPCPLATADFTTTVLNSDGMALTEYLRPVNWILSSGSGKESVVVVISPHEANELLPTIRKSNKVRLHIYAPRVTSSMRSFSDLTFHSIPDSSSWFAPAHVRTELNLFAGQLYFDGRGEYVRVCKLLALSIAHPGAEYSEIDGFVPPEYRTGGSSPFARSRISIVKTLIGLRRKGMGYQVTHLGQILNARPLSEEILDTMSP